MSEIEVSLRGAAGRTIWQLGEDPVVLRFRAPLFESADWRVGSYPGIIPALELDELAVRDGLMTVAIESPASNQPQHYVVNRVKMNYPSPGVCCLFNELPAAFEAPRAWTEWHVLIRGGQVVVEKQPPILVKD